MTAPQWCVRHVRGVVVWQAVQMHFALFHGSGGFVLKAAEMCAGPADAGGAPADEAPTATCPVYGNASSCVEDADEGSFPGTSNSHRASCAAMPSPPRSRAKVVQAQLNKAARSELDMVPQSQLDDFWPPPRETLLCTTIELLSVHNLPKVHAHRRRTKRRTSDIIRYEVAPRCRPW